MTAPSPSGVIEKRDSKPLLDIQEVVGGWPVAMDKWSENAGKAMCGGSSQGWVALGLRLLGTEASRPRPGSLP